MHGSRALPLGTIAVLVFAALTAACGEFAYKRGASASDLEQARSGCRASTKPGQTYEQCMNALGWTVQNFDDESLLATTMVNPDNRSTEPPAQSASSASTAVAAKPAAQGATVSTTPSSSTKPADPMDRLKIGSLWKLGGSSAELDGVIDDCVATLGDAHRPSADRQVMTRGLVRCLREKGWYGVSNR